MATKHTFTPLKLCLAIVVVSIATACNAKDEARESVAVKPAPTSVSTPAPVATQEKDQTTSQSLQQILQEVQALEKENARLEQQVQQASEENQKLGTEIDKIRPELEASSPQ